MIFQWPGAFGGFVLVIVVGAWGLWDAKERRQNIEKFAGPVLASRYVPPELMKRRRLKGILLIAILTLLCLALAGPRYGKRLRAINRRGSDVVICIDVSASMMAEDVAPNRITKAKRELSELIEKLKGDRVGIVSFAGAAFLQCPLTTDTDAATMYLDLLDPATFPVPGTDIGAAIRLATKTLPAEGHSAIVLLTDGEDFGKDTREAVKEAAQKGIKIFTIGFGTPQGELIRIRDASGQVTGFKKDEKGQTVVSHLDEALLVDIARQTQGRTFLASTGDIEVDELAQEIEKMEKKSFGTEEISQLEYRFQIPLAFALLCALIELLIPERPSSFKNFLPKPPSHTIAIIIVLCATSRVFAGFREDINEGNKKYLKARWDDALTAYRSAQTEQPGSGIASYNIGNTLYREGKFDEAELELSRSTMTLPSVKLKAHAHYNRGNCFYRAGQNSAAIEEYKKALLLDPNDEDAKFNLEFVKYGHKSAQAKASAQPKSGKSGQNEMKAAGAQKQKGNEKNQGGEKNPEALSKEDAERILQAIREQEKQFFQSKRTQKPLLEQSPEGKDW